MKDEHRFYLRVAEVTSGNSHCGRNKVGAIIVKNGNIIAFGYNGTPSGFPNQCEEDDGRTTKPEVIHAEANAICKCAASKGDCFGARLYVTLSPCIECAKLIIQSGIMEVYYREKYRNDDGIILLAKADIHAYQVHERTTGV